ncbi:MAG TPA: addiction module toxin RelE [Ruminococcus sp.]|nr:addiction module toxin RelE [Ruminococcus sp.]
MIVKLSKTFQKSFKALDKPMKQRVRTAIEKLPLGDIKKLQGYTAMYRLRIGNYRVIFEMNNDIIYIKDILPRGQAYNNI